MKTSSVILILLLPGVAFSALTAVAQPPGPGIFPPPPPPEQTPPMGKMPIPSLAKDRIVVGGDMAYPPYSFLDEEGKPQGHDVEIMNALADKLNVQVEYRLRPWAEA
ncbi:MAG TPA: transporter substrate-binding domain-containing protein, partial [bacterium]|nr:transporter substrate-binding domain-containing protein [bacterium]